MAKKIHQIDRILRRVLRKMDLDTKLEGYRIWALWPDIVGDQIARRAQPERFRNRILFIRVSNSAWMQQLQMMKPVLLEKIQKALKGAGIKDLRFSLGEVNPPVPPPVELQSEGEMKPPRLSTEVEASLERIEDNELKTLLRGIMLKEAGRLMRKSHETQEKKAHSSN
jgi:hypothetical protein